MLDSILLLVAQDPLEQLNYAGDHVPVFENAGRKTIRSCAIVASRLSVFLAFSWLTLRIFSVMYMDLVLTGLNGTVLQWIERIRASSLRGNTSVQTPEQRSSGNTTQQRISTAAAAAVAVAAAANNSDDTKTQHYSIITMTMNITRAPPAICFFRSYGLSLFCTSAGGEVEAHELVTAYILTGNAGQGNDRCSMRRRFDSRGRGSSSGRSRNFDSGSGSNSSSSRFTQSLT